MSYLTALLAFSAIMIVLTTLATVVVEGIHAILRKRASDFESLLTQLYEQAVRPKLAAAGVEIEATTDRFVEDLIRNPAFAAAEQRWYAKVPVIGKLLRSLSDTSFQELSTRQFVEQLRQTEVGKKLAALADAKAVGLLGKLAWEFERFGEAANTYFRRRATVYSLLVAFVLAAGFNIEAFSLYSALAKDQTLSEQVIAGVDVNRLEASYLKRLDGVDAEQSASLQAEYEKVLESLRSESKALEGLGLPIGTAYYPFCAGQPAGSRTNPTDPRCEEIPPVSVRRIEVPIVGPLLSKVIQVLDDVTLRVLGSRHGWAWLFNVLVSAGLIGLGAPFWFKTFRTVASLVPGVRPEATPTVRPKQDARLTQQEAARLASSTVGRIPETGGLGAGAASERGASAVESPAPSSLVESTLAPTGTPADLGQVPEQPGWAETSLFVAFQNAGQEKIEPSGSR